LSHPLNLFLSPAFSLSLTLCLSFFLTLILSPSVSLSFTLCLSFSPPLPLCLSVSLSLSLTLSLFQLCSLLPSYEKKMFSLISAWHLNKQWQADGLGEECLQSKTTYRLLAHMLTHIEEV
jgi:hypothetical protein